MTTVKDLRRETRLAVVIADQEGVITYVNRPFLDLFGWSRAEIVGRSLTAIIPPNLHDAHNLGFSRFTLTRKSTVLDRPLTLAAVTKDGRVFDAEHFIVAGEEGGRRVFAATIRPLS